MHDTRKSNDGKGESDKHLGPPCTEDTESVAHWGKEEWEEGKTLAGGSENKQQISQRLFDCASIIQVLYMYGSVGPRELGPEGKIADNAN